MSVVQRRIIFILEESLEAGQKPSVDSQQALRTGRHTSHKSLEECRYGNSGLTLCF